MYLKIRVALEGFDMYAFAYTAHKAAASQDERPFLGRPNGDTLSIFTFYVRRYTRRLTVSPIFRAYTLV